MRLGISAVAFVAGFTLLLYGSFKAYTLPPIPAETISENYRIIFFHVPSAISSFVAFTITFAFSIAFLRSENYRYDVMAYTSAKFGVLMITAALISGSVWAKVAWGSYWNWDPRETFVLILWFAYVAYFALRSSIEEYSTKAKFSAVYSIFAFVTIPLSYLSSKIFFSLHPTTSELNFDMERGMALLAMMVAFILLYVSYLLVDSRLEEIKERMGGEFYG
jgi:heme exporter protein C